MMFDWMRGTTAVAALVCGMGVSWSACAQVTARQDVTTAVAATYSFEAQDLSSALVALTRQSKRNVLFDPAIAGGKKSPKVAAASFEDALRQLLRDSGLKFDIGADGSAIVVRQEAALSPPPAAPKRAARQESGPVPEELEVVGSRLSRSQDGPTPVTVFNREKIDQLGASNVADVLRYVPQQSFAFATSFAASGSQAVQLRGLGPGTTLVLLNGRRIVPGAAGAQRAVFDLNTIPLSAVERIEVLSDSASAVYGADAVGGVVNVVLKTSIDRPSVSVSYGRAEGGADEKRVTSSIGGRTDRARGMVIVDYLKRELLLGDDRAITADYDFRRFGGTDNRSLVANPGNICAVSGNLTGLSAPCAAVPQGSSGIALTPANFLATAGQQNYSSALIRSLPLVPEYKSYSGLATGAYDVSDKVQAFGELMYADRRAMRTGSPGRVSNGLVPANNPFNPFGVAVRANFLIAGLPLNQSVTNEYTYRETGGLKGAYNGWDWELSVLGTQSSSDLQTFNSVDATRLAAALAATNPAQALNVFQDGPGGSPALLASLLVDPSATAVHLTARQFQAGGFTRGTLFELPAGAAQLVAGGEWRRETVSNVQRIAPASLVQAARRSWSGYGEFRLPVLGETDWGPARNLAVTLAGRYDNYSDFGGTFNAQYGVEWRPFPTLLVRGSHGESYRAPTLYNLFGPFTSSANTILGPDPRRNGEAIVANYGSGGNPAVQPETSKTTTVGLVWQPELPSRPRLTTSLWRITQQQRILGAVASSTLIQNEALFPERVVRAAPTAADIAAGLPGRITLVDVSVLNSGRLSTQGVDVSVNATFDTEIGQLSPALSATWIGKYHAADFPTTPVTGRVGVASPDGTIPRWRAVGSLGWSRNGAGITGTARYTPSYADASPGTGGRNGRTVASRTIIDMQASLDLDEALGKGGGFSNGLVARLGVINVFNKAPPYSAAFSLGYDPSQADLRQRFIYLSLTKSF